MLFVTMLHGLPVIIHHYPSMQLDCLHRMALHTRLHEPGNTFSFVSVSDGRVSRLHCIIGLVLNPGTGEEQALLQDVSTNGTHTVAACITALSHCLHRVMITCMTFVAAGTFINGQRMPRRSQAWLADGDRVSLVLSVAPMAEQCFVYRKVPVVV